MLDTSFCRLALSSHQLPPLCGSANLTRGLPEAKPIRQTRPNPHLYQTDFKINCASHLLIRGPGRARALSLPRCVPRRGRQRVCLGQ